jgi:hypothetical protein
LKAWRYIGVFGPELMLCAAAVRIGPVRQFFWAVWDRESRRLYERTMLGRGGCRLELRVGSLRIRDRDVELDLRFAERAGIECVCPTPAGGYGWTRKQPIHARGTARLGGCVRPLDAGGLIDDTSAYYDRHTSWRWSAGVGTAPDGRQLAWNLVDGVNDPPEGSERTIWVAGVAEEAPPSRFAPDLSGVDGLAFAAEAVRERRENRLVVRSRYRQPFGTFSGRLPGGLELAAGYGVMEEHDVHW